MSQFIDRFDSPPVLPASDPTPRRRETVRIMLIGSSEGIEAIMHQLYTLRFAEISEWSQLQPEPHSGNLMRLMTKSFWLD